MTALPEPLSALAAQLEAEGFARDEHPPEPEGFGDQVIELTGADLRVRLTRDRGEWFVEVAHPDWDERFDPDIWRAALEGTDPTDPGSLAEQAAYVRDRLDVLRRGAGDAALFERLDEIATARADLWFG